MSPGGKRLAAGALAILLAAPVGRAFAHDPSPVAILASLDTPEARRALGVERAERDRDNPRVLVVRVGARWHALAPDERLAQARIWHDDWRHAVPQGVVAVLDARSDAPVVGFGPGGRVVLRTAAR